MSELKLLVHAYCPSSFEVVKHLVDKDLYGMLEIVPLNPGNPVFLQRVVPSVPALAIGEKIVALDPLEPGFVESVLVGGDIRSYVPVLEHELVDRFIRSARSSSYVMLHVLLGGLSIRRLITTEFTDMAVRTYFSGLRRDYVRKAVLDKEREIEEVLAEASLKSVAYSFLRDVTVLSGNRVGDFVDYGTLRIWFAAKLSQGVAYTPVRELVNEDAIQRLLEYLERNYGIILGSLERYLAKLSSDSEVYRLLTRGNGETVSS